MKNGYGSEKESESRRLFVEEISYPHRSDYHHHFKKEQNLTSTNTSFN